MQYDGDRCFASSHITKARAVLQKPEVIEIFLLRPLASELNETPCSELVGKRYGVSPKTIRDIWVGRTWYRTTHHLDPTRIDSTERLARHPGRPKGSKDSRPRVSKVRNGAPRVTSRASKKSKQPDTINMRMICQAMPDLCVKPVVQTSNSVFPDIFSVAQKAASVHGPDNLEAFESAKSQAVEKENVKVQPSFVDPFHDDWQHW